MAFRRKLLVLALAVAVALSGCGPAPAKDSPPEEEPPAGYLYYLGSDADPLSKALFAPLEDWARENRWTFVSYDCRGVGTTQKGQLSDLARTETPGVAVLYPTGQVTVQDEGVEALYRAGFTVITLNRPCGSYAKRYVSCHIGLREEDVLSSAARMVSTVQGRKSAGYIRLSDNWPDPQGPDLAQALFPAYHLRGTGYTGGQRTHGQSQVEELMAGEDAPPDFIFSMSQAAALGALDALEGDSAWADTPVFALRGDRAGAREVAYGRLAGVVCASPKDLTARLLDAIPQVASGKRLLHQDLTPTAVTAANARAFLKEFKS